MSEAIRYEYVIIAETNFYFKSSLFLRANYVRPFGGRVLGAQVSLTQDRGEPLLVSESEGPYHARQITL